MKLFLPDMHETSKKLILSIIIVNYNNSELTNNCLNSIKKYAQGLSYEVLLIDNGSTDSSKSELLNIQKASYWREKLHLIINKSNTGYSKANNQGIRNAKGKYILLLNNDTLVHKNTLQEFVEFAEVTTDAGVIGSRLLNVDGTIQMSCYRFPTITNAIKEYWFGRKGLFEKFAPVTKKPVTVDSVVGASFFITPKGIKHAGLLDERYFAYYEDIDYCRQIWKNGLKVYYLPASLVTHIHGATFSKITDEKDQWRKLIPGSKIYNGTLRHYLIFMIMWSGQKFKKLLLSNN